MRQTERDVTNSGETPPIKDPGIPIIRKATTDATLKTTF